MEIRGFRHWVMACSWVFVRYRSRNGPGFLGFGCSRSRPASGWSEAEGHPKINKGVGARKSENEAISCRHALQVCEQEDITKRGRRSPLRSAAALSAVEGRQ